MNVPPNHEAAETPNDPQYAWALSFARGYLELGMLHQAERELNRISPQFQDRPEVMSLRSHLLLARRLWPQVIEHARRAVRLFPDAPEYYVHAAAAYDMLGMPSEGRDVWQAAPEPVRSSGFFHLHVARFEAQLGNVASARHHLARAIDLDPKLRSIARRDPSLASLIKTPSQN